MEGLVVGRKESSWKTGEETKAEFMKKKENTDIDKETQSQRERKEKETVRTIL